MKTEIDFSLIYSFSKLDMFSQCPKRFYFFYLDPEISPRKKEFIKPRDYKTKGQGVHGAITLFYHLPKEERTFSRIKELLYEERYTIAGAKKKLNDEGEGKNIKDERFLESLRNIKNTLKDISSILARTE